MTRVLVAPDKFAGTLTAAEAAAAIGSGWLSARPADVVDLLPMADGGPGFVQTLHRALGGHVVEVPTTGPLGASARGVLLLTGRPDAPTAYVESASTCGLAATSARDPWAASTAGLAALLQAALAAGAVRVVVGVGGTATTDGGRGLVEAVGRWPVDVELVAATDVDAPLLGPLGAARGFGPQKGADDALVERLEQRLTSWAARTGGDPSAPGAGAGGGLGYGLGLLGARRVSGARLVAEAVGLPSRVAAAEVVVTGEGRFDASSLHGKVVAEVAGCCRAAGRPCRVLAGEVTVGAGEAAAAGVGGCGALVDEPGGRQAALADPAAGLARLAARVAGTWSRAR